MMLPARQQLLALIHPWILQNQTAHGAIGPNVWTGGALQEGALAAGVVWSCTNVSGLNVEPFAPGHHEYDRAIDLSN
jgi:hypothetical protein